MDQDSSAARVLGGPARPPARWRRFAQPGHAAGPEQADPQSAVTALYREHALSLIRLAHIVLGGRAGAEDVVHDAFCGLYRRWEHVANKDRALAYVRTSVLNGCRSALRSGRARDVGLDDYQPTVISAEAEALDLEERREVVAALRRLPERQREILVLRYYLDLPDLQIARDLGLKPSTIRSIRHRALASLERSLGGTP